MQNRLYNILAIQCAVGVGSPKGARIYEQLCREGNLDLPFDKLIKTNAFDEKMRERISAVKRDAIEGIVSDCDKENIRIIPIFDNAFPERLRNIPDPPIVIYTKGQLPDFDSLPVICIVGPRRVTDFGRKAAYSLSLRLSKAGFTVVSGSAAGTDTAVHLGALNAGCGSVSVVAQGIITELSSGGICTQVLKRGCIISENSPHAVARKFSFPIRNRLMSALSIGVIVVEAPEISGALITANHAAEQGKDVFVIPGSPAENAYKGSNALLRDGAIPLLDTSDVFSRYTFDFSDKINTERAYEEKNSKTVKKNLQKILPESLSKEAVLVYNNLDKPKFGIDDLSALNLDGAQLLSALTELEIEHIIESVPGGLYKISNK